MKRLYLLFNPIRIYINNHYNHYKKQTKMSQELLINIVTGLISFLTAGGIGSFLYVKQQRKLKESEVKAAEITNGATINLEWEKLCDKKDEDIKRLEDKVDELEKLIIDKNQKIEELNQSKEHAWEETSNSKIQCAKKDRIITEINWFRCEVNGCPYRKPPRKYGVFDFPKDGVVEETPNNIEKF